MNVALFAPSGRLPESERDALAELVRTLVEGVPKEQRTLLVDLIARSFIQLYAAASVDRSPTELLDWAERMCGTHVETPAVRTFFSEVAPRLAAHVRGGATPSIDGALLQTLEPALRAVAAKPRRSLPKAQHHVDEVDAAINGLIVRLERADPLSAEHSRAVSAWCARLARRLSLSEEEVVHVARCGLIHDVGKLTTPVEILHAPRKLTDQEWLLMRDHAPAGERIVLQDPRLAAFAPAVRSHHERLDGKGYPDSLGENEIPLYTRIVTVADCFNAMIGRRPYRLPMPPSVAMEQLETHTGTQFDGDIVAAMRDVV